jgi:hypothetical protein
MAKKFEIKPNTGALFKNNDKQSDNSPDYKGEGHIEGAGEIWINAWLKESKNGVKYFSFSFKPKDVARKPGSGGARPSVRDELADEIPFSPEVR